MINLLHWYNQAEISEIFSSCRNTKKLVFRGMKRFGSHYEFPSVLYTFNIQIQETVLSNSQMETYCPNCPTY